MLAPWDCLRSICNYIHYSTSIVVLMCGIFDSILVIRAPDVNRSDDFSRAGNHTSFKFDFEIAPQTHNIRYVVADRAPFPDKHMFDKLTYIWCVFVVVEWERTSPKRVRNDKHLTHMKDNRESDACCWFNSQHTSKTSATVWSQSRRRWNMMGIIPWTIHQLGGLVCEEPRTAYIEIGVCVCVCFFNGYSLHAEFR